MEEMLEKYDLKKIRIAISIVLFLTVLTQLIDNAFNLITPILVEKFSISSDVASWVASIGGIGIAIGFFAFSSFTDFFSEKKLLILGLLFFCLPSITGLLFQNSYTIVVISRFVQAIGGISTSALYLVLIARYLPAKEQVIWMGLSTASFTISTVIGTLTGGYISTFLGWQCIFYIPFLAIFTLPIIMKCLPDNPKEKNSVDYLGFLILAIFSINVNFLVSNPNLLLFVTGVIITLCFGLYIKKTKNPIISIEFFRNKDYVITLGATFFYYLPQVGLAFLVPFLMQTLFQYSLEKIALIYIIPYTVSGTIAIFSGSIINKIGMKRALTLGATLIIIGFLFGGCFSYQGTQFVIATLTIITGGYALSFAPFLTRAITTLDEKEVGTGIAVFMFVVRIANALGISVAAFLLNFKPMQTKLIPVSNTDMVLYTNIFLVLAIFILIGITTYLITYKKEEK